MTVYDAKGPTTGLLVFGWDEDGGLLICAPDGRRFAQIVAKLVLRAQGVEVDVSGDLAAAQSLVELLLAADDMQGAYSDPTATRLRPWAECAPGGAR